MGECITPAVLSGCGRATRDATYGVISDALSRSKRSNPRCKVSGSYSAGAFPPSPRWGYNSTMGTAFTIVVEQVRRHERPVAPRIGNHETPRRGVLRYRGWLPFSHRIACSEVTAHVRLRAVHSLRIKCWRERTITNIPVLALDDPGGRDLTAGALGNRE